MSTNQSGDFYDIEVKDIEGKAVPVSSYRGKTLLIVNTASQCGFTPQYEGLNALYKRYQERSVTVLGFPAISDSPLEALY